jgi:DNA-binding NtrC family response regulator
MIPVGMSEVLLGSSIAIQKVRALIQRVGPTNLPVLITGPTGSGKELVAQAIHAASRRNGNLVSFNVCAIAETMFEDALFGHVRGAFTGALNSAPGYLREADRGTAFFDEIGGLSLSAQAKLLRAVETRAFRPVGAHSDAHSDFRLVAAANEDIWDLERAGRFRSDLAHRLSSFVIRVPALRDHAEDIPLLALSFLREFGGETEASLGRDTIRLLTSYDWPGNVRELRHVVRSAVTLGGSGNLRAEDIREALSWMAPRSVPSPLRSLADRRFMDVLELCGWDTNEAARHLGVHRTTIFRRMKRIGIEMRQPILDGKSKRNDNTPLVGTPQSA